MNVISEYLNQQLGQRLSIFPGVDVQRQGFLVSLFALCFVPGRLNGLGEGSWFSHASLPAMKRGEQEQAMMCLAGEHSAVFW